MPEFYVIITIFMFIIIYFVNPIVHEYDGKLKSMTFDLNNKYTNTPAKLTYSSNKNTNNDIFEDIKTVPKLIVRTYSGAVAILPCKLNVSKLWNKPAKWLYKTNYYYKPVQEDDEIITDYNLTIYNVRTIYAGDYRCLADEQLEMYPDGIPCRSQILLPSIRKMPSVQQRPNEIMLGLCRVRCKEAIVNIRSQSGDIIESVNNTAGIYSLHQNPPLQPPLPARRIMYVEPGERVIIICYGTTLRDIPFTWRVDTHEVSPRYLWSASGDRIHLNARDHIVIKHVLYSDARVYSCWQDGVLCGVVKLRVHRNTKTTARLRLRIFIFILILAIVLRLALRLIRYRVRYLGIQV